MKLATALLLLAPLCVAIDLPKQQTRVLSDFVKGPDFLGRLLVEECNTVCSRRTRALGSERDLNLFGSIFDAGLALVGEGITTIADVMVEAATEAVSDVVETGINATEEVFDAGLNTVIDLLGGAIPLPIVQNLVEAGAKALDGVIADMDEQKAEVGADIANQVTEVFDMVETLLIIVEGVLFIVFESLADVAALIVDIPIVFVTFILEFVENTIMTVTSFAEALVSGSPESLAFAAAKMRDVAGGESPFSGVVDFVEALGGDSVTVADEVTKAADLMNKAAATNGDSAAVDLVEADLAFLFNPLATVVRSLIGATAYVLVKSIDSLVGGTDAVLGALVSVFEGLLMASFSALTFLIPYIDILSPGAATMLSEVAILLEEPEEVTTYVECAFLECPGKEDELPCIEDKYDCLLTNLELPSL